MDHHDAGCVGGGVLENIPDTHHVGVFDLAYNAEVPEAAGDRTTRNAVGRIHGGDDHPRYLERRAQVFRDVPQVPGVLELVGLLPEESGEAEVAGDGPEPTDVVVARDHHIRRRLPEGIEVRAGVRELLVRAALGQVTRDGHSVRPVLDDELTEGVEAFGDRGPPEVQVRNMHEGRHVMRFYPNIPLRQTLLPVGLGTSTASCISTEYPSGTRRGWR